MNEITATNSMDLWQEGFAGKESSESIEGASEAAGNCARQSG